MSKQNLTFEGLGRAKKVTIDKDKTTIIAKLVGGVAVIKVGAATETEMKEKKARVEDQEGAIVVARAKDMGPEEGFNALNDKYENLVRAGVIDPTKVVRTALQNAASIASLILRR